MVNVIINTYDRKRIKWLQHVWGFVNFANCTKRWVRKALPQLSQDVIDHSERIRGEHTERERNSRARF